MLNVKNTASALLLSGLLLSSTAITPAKAYWDKYDYTEAVYIQPNQSAFWVPDTGGNLTSQSQFGSAKYYSDNKVASKRFQIPHAKLVNSGSWSDYYVPAGRLIVVDRTPFNRAWTRDSGTGTSTKNEGFRVESADSLGIDIDIVATAFVSEEDAATFLYWFGTRSANYDPNHPEQQFQSVIYGKSLEEVMDSIVHSTIQARLAEQFAASPLIEAIGHKAAIIKAVFESVRDEFRAKGITIQTIGYASDLSFDPTIQKAINDNFIAAMKAKELASLAPVLPTMQEQTNMDVKRILASKWNGVLTFPTFIPSGFVDRVLNWFTVPAQQTSAK